MRDINIYIHTSGIKTVNTNWSIISGMKINRLYYIHSGYCLCDGVKLEPGKLHLISEKMTHEWEAHNMNHLYFDFLITPPLKFDSIYSIDMDNHPEIIAFIESYEKILTKYSIPKDNLTALPSSFLKTLLTIVNKVTPITIEYGKRISAILEMLYSSDKMFTIDELAKTIYMDKYQFIRLFNSEVGTTPYKFMNSLRLDKALNLLKNGESIKDTAFACGFLSESAFSTSFKKKFMVNPSKIIKNLNKT